MFPCSNHERESRQSSRQDVATHPSVRIGDWNPDTNPDKVSGNASHFSERVEILPFFLPKWQEAKNKRRCLSNSCQSTIHAGLLRAFNR